MDGHELLPEGLLDETDHRHCCPRCREVAHAVSQQVYEGGLVLLLCPNGHRWTFPYLDLPAMASAG